MNDVNRRNMLIGDHQWEIIGPEPETVFADGVSEIRIIHGVAYISLTQHAVDGDNPGRVQVATRLRLPSVVAQVLADNILGAIEKTNEAANSAKQKAN